MVRKTRKTWKNKKKNISFPFHPTQKNEKNKKIEKKIHKIKKMEEHLSSAPPRPKKNKKIRKSNLNIVQTGGGWSGQKSLFFKNFVILRSVWCSGIFVNPKNFSFQKKGFCVSKRAFCTPEKVSQYFSPGNNAFTRLSLVLLSSLRKMGSSRIHCDEAVSSSRTGTNHRVIRRSQWGREVMTSSFSNFPWWFLKDHWRKRTS